jgi:glycosyltransferase involved in cell wall biosynthesis
MIELTLVIPCFNESQGLGKLFDRCVDALIDQRLEIILVNNGSTDNTEDIFAMLKKRNQERLKFLTVKENLGYGHGILQGLGAATSKYIGWTHADLQTDPVDALRAIPLIIGSSHPLFIKGKRHGRPLSDVVFTFGMSIYETLLLRRGLWDINAQPTIFPREFYENWKNPPTDFSLDLFAYASAKAAKYPVKRIQVLFGTREFGTSSWNVDWKSKIKFIKRTIAFSRELKGRL